VTVPWVPVIEATADVDTAVVAILKLAVFAPAAIVTEAGKLTFALLDARETTVPPGPAGPFRVAVPVAEFPPVMEFGETDRLERLAGAIVNVADCEFGPWVPVIVAVTDNPTAEVDMLNVADVAPAGIFTELGTVALELLDASVTTVPLGPAGPLSEAVPIEPLPPTTEFGEMVKLDSDDGVIVRAAVKD
jgi:hypothetical protein